jgi:hypothetical protein
MDSMTNENADESQEIPAPVVDVVDVEPVAKPAPKRKPEPAPYNVETTSRLTGTVVLSALTFRAYSRNSASVKLLQERLVELGHTSCHADTYGWLADGTMAALREFQSQQGLFMTGEADRATVEALMAGTAVVIS